MDRLILPNKCFMLLEIDLLWQVVQQKTCLYGNGAIDLLRGKILNFLTWGELFISKGRKPIIPVRYTVYRYAKLSMPQIYALGVKNLFIESPELLFAAVNYKWESVCYRFAGVNNPVANSRYSMG